VAEGPAAVARLDGLTRRLRSECPWDREQDERSIVPHTVEEAYELADAAQSGDDARLLDELGDVLFQVHFLALLLEERGAGDLAAVAEHCSQKLIRRHPHVFGEAEAADAQAVLERWDAIKRAEEGRPAGATGDLPGNLPATIYARKLQRRAAAGGRPQAGASEALSEAAREATRLSEALRGERETHPSAGRVREERFERIGELLYATVGAARELGVDAELALRAAADRRREEASPQ
jgi:MazG family protein